MDKKKKLIRDVVYEYVYFTPIEALVIEAPLFQRLRFIYQNSSAYLTYPSNQLSRFSHSLGVMHIGGMMTLSALKNTTKDDFWELLSHIECKLSAILERNNLFEKSIANFEAQWPLGNISEFVIQHGRSSAQDSNSKCDPVFLVNYLWQSLRIACLIHDIGHFSYSHVFEMGLESFERQHGNESSIVENLKKNIANGLSIEATQIKKATEIHEYFGACLLKYYSRDLDQENPDAQVLQVCLDLAIEIFTYQESGLLLNNDDGFLSCLHQIVSSFLDADRLDYVLRDSFSSGLQVGNFDYKRLIDNLTIIRIEREITIDGGATQNKKIFSFLVTDKALSSVEQFYNHRYILYEYLYYHHNVCKYDGILMEVISEILYLGVIKDDPFFRKALLKSRFLVVNRNDTYSIILDDRDKIADIAPMLDDCWLRGLLQVMLSEIRGNVSYVKLELLLEAFLFRKTENTYSVLKKEPDVDKFLKEFISYLKESQPDLHLSLQSLLQVLNGTGMFNNSTELRTMARYLFASYFTDGKSSDKKKVLIKSEFIQDVYVRSAEFAIFIYKDVSPKIADEFAPIYYNEKYTHCTKISPYLAAFRQIKDTSFNHYFGFVAKGIKHDIDLQNKCKGILFEALSKTLDKCIQQEYSNYS